MCIFGERSETQSRIDKMRSGIYRHMVKTRGWKYSVFLNYLRIFKYAAFAPERGEFLESYYTLMRYIDDVVDGDISLPAGYKSEEEYIINKIQFSQNPVNLVDEVDYLMVHCFEVASKIGQKFDDETKDILESLLFDARRRGKLIIFNEKELHHHFHLLDIRGTIKATLKVFNEDPEKYTLLEPLGKACRYQFDIEDFETDIQAGYINITKEECKLFDIELDELTNASSPKIQNWLRYKAERGLELLEEHYRNVSKGKFSLLTRLTLPLVYERPARKLFKKVLALK